MALATSPRPKSVTQRTVPAGQSGVVGVSAPNHAAAARHDGADSARSATSPWSTSWSRKKSLVPPAVPATMALPSMSRAQESQLVSCSAI